MKSWRENSWQFWLRFAEAASEMDVLLQRAKTLNARLSPVYRALFGGVRLIWTEHPSWVWWPRANEDATQALAALEGGMVRLDSKGEGHNTQAHDSTSAQRTTTETASPEALACFVIGPIGDELGAVGSVRRRIYEDAIEVFENVIEPACEELGVRPIRADKMSRPGEITEQVCRMLRDADVVIADLTGGNPNVMYELGLRHTRNQLTVQIGEVDRLPFDINVIRTIRFRRTESGLITARNKLKKALEGGLTGGFDPVTATRVWNEPEPISLEIPDPMASSAEDVRQRGDEGGEEQGFLDTLVQMEDSFEAVQEAMAELGSVIEELGSLAESSTTEINELAAKGGGARGGLAIVIRFASAVEEPVSRLEQLALKYEKNMRGVEPGMDHLIREVEEDPSKLGEAADLVSTVAGLDEAARDAMDSMGAMAQGVASLEPISRALRGPARRIRSSLGRIQGATKVIHSWRTRIDAIANTPLAQG